MNKKYKDLVGSLIVVGSCVYIVVPALKYSSSGLDILYVTHRHAGPTLTRTPAPGWWFDNVLSTEDNAYRIAVSGLGKQDG